MDSLENSNWTGRARKPRRELPGFENYRAVPLKPTSIDNVPYSVEVHRLRGKWLLRVGVSQERSRRSRYARFLGVPDIGPLHDTRWTRCKFDLRRLDSSYLPSLQNAIVSS